MRNNIHDSRRAQLKCRILTRTYTFQSNRAVFNQFAVDPTCKVCEKSPETRQHFIAECQTLQHARQNFYMKTRDIVDSIPVDISSPGDVTQLILDYSVFLENKFEIDLLEFHSRELISSLHRIRTKLLSDKERQQSLAVPISKFASQFQQTAENQKSDYEIDVELTVRRKVTGGAIHDNNNNNNGDQKGKQSLGTIIVSSKTYHLSLAMQKGTTWHYITFLGNS